MYDSSPLMCYPGMTLVPVCAWMCYPGMTLVPGFALMCYTDYDFRS